MIGDSMMENISGVNSSGLDRLATDIIDYTDKLNKIFNQLQLLVDETNKCFLSDVGNDFRSKFKEQSYYFQEMNQNILSYATDFVKVNAKYRNSSMNMADIFNTVEK